MNRQITIYKWKHQINILFRATANVKEDFEADAELVEPFKKEYSWKYHCGSI